MTEKVEARVLSASERKRLYKESKEAKLVADKWTAINAARVKNGLPEIIAGQPPQNVYTFKQEGKK